jgi:hypothetical protein
LLVISVGGCIVVEDHRGGIGGDVPVGATTSSIKNGAGITIQPGVQAGYGITANAGTSFRVIWTGDAASTGSGFREFWGSVWTSGRFDSLIPGCANNACPLEANQGDYVSPVISVPSGQRIDWDTFASDGIDGFDFTATAEPIYFDMLIDGVRYPTLTIFTDAASGQVASAPSLPFALTTR